MKHSCFFAAALFLAAFFCPFTSQLKADEVPSSAPKTSQPIARAKTRVERCEDIARAYIHYDYEQVLIEGMPLLEAEPDLIEPYWSQTNYYVGMSAYKRGWYQKAEYYLKQIESPGLLPYTSAKILERIKNLRAAAPKQSFDVTDGDRVIFRVYADSMDDWNQALLDELPRAKQVNQELMQYDFDKAVVFVFSNSRQMEQYLCAMTGKESYETPVWAMNADGIILFCRNRTGSQPTPAADSSWFRSSIAHELNHLILSRMASQELFPGWFEEGLASHIGCQAEPTEWRKLKTRFMTAGNNHMLQDPDKLETIEKLQELTLAAMPNRDQGLPGPDTYAQSWSMIQFLLKQLKGTPLPELITQSRESRSFDTALKKCIGRSKKEFYEDYIAWVKQGAPE